MRSRTDSESVRTSRPSTKAEPLLSGRTPVSILMTVVFPLPLGPRKPKISPFSTRKLTSLTAVKVPKRLTRCSAEIAACGRDCAWVALVSALGFPFHNGGHASEDKAGGGLAAKVYGHEVVFWVLPGP